MDHPMNPERIAQLRAKGSVLYQQARQWVVRVPLKARVVLGLFLVAAVMMAIYTALTAKDSSLHFKVQHGFHNAQVSVWVDSDLVYSGTITGSTKKKFGFLPTDAVQGSLSQIIPVRSGPHTVRVRVAPDDATAQDDTITGDFARNGERTLSVSARHNGLSLAWQGTGAGDTESPSGFAWLSRYATSLLLTIGGSIISALTGFALRELPGRLRPTPDAPKPELGPQ
jgi:hypothetical protein